MLSGAEIKVMETESYRRQKADEQPQQTFMDFSPEQAAVRDEAHRKAAATGQAYLPAAAEPHASQSAGAAQEPQAAPAALTPQDAAMASIEKIRHEVDDLAKQVRSRHDSMECDCSLHTSLRHPC